MTSASFNILIRKPFRLETNPAEDPLGETVIFSIRYDGIHHLTRHHAKISGTINNLRFRKLIDDFVELPGKERANSRLSFSGRPLRRDTVIVLDRIMQETPHIWEKSRRILKIHVHRSYIVSLSHRKPGIKPCFFPGVHNTRDALGAVATALYCEIPFDKIAAALSNFCGVKRRFETKAKIDDLWIIDDYAHHPTEIKATLKGARETGSRRMICAFQPHRYSRTKLLKDEFADAFVDADVIFFTDIYSAGEKPIEGIDGKLIPEIVKAKFPDKEVYYVENVNDLPEKLYDFLRPHDMFITMGAGNIYTAGEKLIELIKEKGIASDYKK